MTMGTMMFYGGIAGVAVSLLAAIICAVVFPKQRVKALKKLSE